MSYSDLKRQLKAQAEELRRSLSSTLSQCACSEIAEPCVIVNTEQTPNNVSIVNQDCSSAVPIVVPTKVKLVRLAKQENLSPFSTSPATKLITLQRKPREVSTSTVDMNDVSPAVTQTIPLTTGSSMVAPLGKSAIESEIVMKSIGQQKNISKKPADREVSFVVSLSEELQRCKEILRELQKHPAAGPFLTPVDTMLYPKYRTLVTKPMDLGTIWNKLCSGEYFTPDDLAQDVRLVWYNCRLFNPEGHPLRSSVDTLEELFTERYNHLLETKQQQCEDAETAPLLQKVDLLRQELLQLQTDPSLTIEKAKVQEVKSDEPLGFGDIRKLTQMINELQNDAETINKVVTLIRQSCPKAVDIVNDNLDLDLELLDPRTVREVQSICDRAIGIRKRKRSATSSHHSHLSRSSKSTTRHHLVAQPPPSESGGPAPPSESSVVSKKSNTSSFGRETYSAPPPPPPPVTVTAAPAPSPPLPSPLPSSLPTHVTGIPQRPPRNANIRRTPMERPPPSPPSRSSPFYSNSFQNFDFMPNFTTFGSPMNAFSSPYGYPQFGYPMPQYNGNPFAPPPMFSPYLPSYPSMPSAPPRMTPPQPSPMGSLWAPPISTPAVAPRVSPPPLPPVQPVISTSPVPKSSPVSGSASNGLPAVPMDNSIEEMSIPLAFDL